MRRRDFITLLSSAAATWPLAARAQQSERVRRIGVLTPTSSDNPGQHARIEAFRNALEALGWSVGRNLQVDVRWAAGDVDLLRDTRPNWWRPRPMSFSPLPIPRSRRCVRRRALCPSYL